MKRRKKRGVYFLNRPAPTERAWLLAHGASEEDLAFPDPGTDPLAGLFPDPVLKERFGPLFRRLAESKGRALLFDEVRQVPFRAFTGIGPADREGDHPEGLILVRGPDLRSRIPGLSDDAPGARDLLAFYRGGLGALSGGGDRVGLALPAEVLPWSKARKHDLARMDFLPEHRTRNLRIFWDGISQENAEPETVLEDLFDAAGRVYRYRGGETLEFHYETVLKFLEEAALRIAAGNRGGPLSAEEVESAAPGHVLGELARFRALPPDSIDPVELRAALRRAESAGAGREEMADLQVTLLAREERWEELNSEMRRAALGPARSRVDRPQFWRWLARAAEARTRPADFRETALAAAAGPLSPASRGAICDLLTDAGEVEAAVAVLERWMRPGQTPDPGLAQRVERLRALRPGRGR